MSRYIDADAIEYHEVFEGDEFVRVAYGDDIDNIPTADVVEVVRCCDADKGDCMFNHWHETPNGDKYHICNLNKLSFSEHADFYCAYGERREDGRNAISIQKGRREWSENSYDTSPEQKESLR